MSTLPQRNFSLYITLGLVAVGAVVAGIILFSSGKASEVDLTTARYVPEDAGLYVALNTDLSSDQWVATFKLLGRLGQPDAEDELRDGVESGGLDWEDQIAPFLGGNAAVYLRLASTGDVFSNVNAGAVIAKVSDTDKALDVFEDFVGASFDDDEYEGAEVYIDDEFGLFIGVHDGHMIFATNEDTLFDAIDAGTGKSPNLTSVQDFRTLRDELSRNFLLFFYVNGKALLEDFLEGEGSVFSEAFAEAGVYDLTMRPNAWVIGAKDNSFEGQHAALGDPGAIGPLTAPRDSKLVRLVPGETAVFISSHQLSQTYHAIVDDARDAIDDAIREQGEYRDLDDALSSAGEEIGIDHLEDLIDLFTGEVAIALWFPSNDEDAPEFVMLAEVEDEGEARDLFEDILQANALSFRDGEIAGVDVIYFVDEDGDEAVFVVRDGVAMIGTEAGIEAVLDPSGPSLAEMRRYRDTVASTPTRLGTFAYFDVNALVRLETAGVVPQLDDAQRALEGAIINVVNERDVVRTSGVITISD